MAKKCIYCSIGIPHESVIDFCERCGKGVWGDKMFNAIVENMENARENGDLHLPTFKDSPSTKQKNTDSYPLFKKEITSNG